MLPVAWSYVFLYIAHMSLEYTGLIDEEKLFYTTDIKSDVFSGS
jgi:hypothetical protein